MRKYLSYFTCLLFLAACVKVEPGVPSRFEGDEERVMRFSARLADGGEWVPLQTKADASLDDLKDNAGGNGWGVYAYYTDDADYTKPGDAAGVIFNKRRVWWDGSAWQYHVDTDHKKEYWPMDADEKVTFFAFAPWSLYGTSASVDPDKGPQVTYTASTDLTQQQDLLWATNSSGLPHRNVNLATYRDPSTNPNGTVDFHFRHAPAKVHFTINGATLGDESGQPSTYGNATTQTTYTDFTRSTDAAGWNVNSGGSRTVYWAYRKKTVTTTQTYRQFLSGFKILVNGVEMKNFIKQGTLHLNNPDAYIPDWTEDESAGFIDYTFGTSDLTTAITNPGNESTLSAGWGTTYLGVDADPKELIPAPDNYIYMIPKAAEAPGPESKNISISVTYHVIGLTKTVQFTRTTTTVSWQRVPYFTRNFSYYYQTGNNQNNANSYTSLNDTQASSTNNNVKWVDYTDSNHSSTTTITDGATSDVGAPSFNYSQDNEGRGFKAVGTINTDILGGRNYTVNLFLDGRELNLTVIPQPWDLYETTYDYNNFLNPVEQSLTYDSDFVYEVIDDNVYINNRMGKFYFRLGSGMYLYWQASLIGDDAFAFTDENGNYLRDDAGDLLTTVRGDISRETNYIYVKAINTASKVTSKAKLRIYLFNSENHAVVALPQPNWLFVSASYLDSNNQTKRVEEWTVVQTAN